MSVTEQDMDIFDRCRKGDLSAVEKADLESRLESDAALKEHFRQYNLSINALITFGIGQELRDIIETEHDQKRKNVWIISAAAAAVIFLISIPLYLYFQSNSNPDLFAAYYTPFPADQQVRGSEQTDMAMNLYREGKYAEAARVFESAAGSGKSDQRMLLLLGNCYLNLNDPAKAVGYLERSSEGESTILSQSSDWYLALAFLKQDNIERARIQLSSMATQNHLYRDRAKQLLLDLP